MIKTIRYGYHSLFLLVGTSRFFLWADFLFIYDLIIEKRKIKYPPFALWLVVFPLAISLFWSLNPNDGFQTVVRIVLLAVMLPTYKYRGEYNRILLVSLVIMFALISFQSLEVTRPIGIHMNASSLGQSGFVFMSSRFLPVALISGFILSLSVARSPLLVFAIFAIFSRKKQVIITALVTTAIFFIVAFIQTPNRVVISGITDGIDKRIQTLKPSEPINDDCGVRRDLKYQVFGYGFQSFCNSTGHLRPHNIYILSVYELGILAVPFWIGIVMLARKFPLRSVAPLFLLGFITEELFGRPEGVYLIAIWLISSDWIRHEIVIEKSREKIIK